MKNEWMNEMNEWMNEWDYTPVYLYDVGFWVLVVCVDPVIDEDIVVVDFQFGQYYGQVKSVCRPVGLQDRPTAMILNQLQQRSLLLLFDYGFKKERRHDFTLAQNIVMIDIISLLYKTTGSPTTDCKSSEPLKTLVMLCYVYVYLFMLRYVMLCYVILCCAVLCSAMLCYDDNRPEFTYDNKLERILQKLLLKRLELSYWE